MPCVTSHYTNPKNVFTPKPLNPSPIGEVACHGLEWHSGPCPTVTYTWLDLESNGLRDVPHEFELITHQKTANSHHIGHISNICSKLKLPLIRRLKACMESKSSIHGGERPKVNAHVHPHFTLETPSDMGATHCPSQPMILRPILVILRAPSQMEYAIRHMVVFNSKVYANI